MSTDSERAAAFREWMESPEYESHSAEAAFKAGAAWQARAAIAQQPAKRCEWCDDTGDVVSITGEWRGRCICPEGAAIAQQAEPDPTDPGHDVATLREHVRHLERRVRQLAPRADAQPVAPTIDYDALIAACFQRTKAAQGTRGCVQFAKGAEWFREQCLAAAPTARQPLTAWRPIETAPDGVMLLFADMKATEARHWVFCGWRHSGVRGSFVQMPDDTARSATHWMPLPPPPGGITQEGE